MTIKTKTTVYCDSPNCEESYEMPEPTLNHHAVYRTLRLEGWYVGNHGKHQVCSACIGHAERSKALYAKAARISRRKLRIVYRPLDGVKYHWYHPVSDTHGYGSDYPSYSVLFAKNQ